MNRIQYEKEVPKQNEKKDWPKKTKDEERAVNEKE